MIFLPHPSSPARRFSKITPVPSLPLKRGSTSPSAPSPQERASTGKPAVLYSQASARPQGVARNCLRNRIAVFRKSSPVPFFTVKEGAPPLPRLPLLRRGLQPVNRLFCTRKQALAPAGLLVIICATELRLFMRRGRG